MDFIRSYFKERKTGFYISFASACLGVISAIAFIFAYISVSETTDELYKALSIGVIVITLIGGLSGIVAEFFRKPVIGFIPVALLAVGAALFWDLNAYIIANYLTVPFFNVGYSYATAGIFAGLFTAAAVGNVVSTFFEH